MFVFLWALSLAVLCHVRKEHMVTALWEISIILREAATSKRDERLVLKCALNSKCSEEFREGEDR